MRFKKIIYLLLIVFLFSLTGCNSLTKTTLDPYKNYKNLHMEVTINKRYNLEKDIKINMLFGEENLYETKERYGYGGRGEIKVYNVSDPENYTVLFSDDISDEKYKYTLKYSHEPNAPIEIEFNYGDEFVLPKEIFTGEEGYIEIFYTVQYYYDETLGIPSMYIAPGTKFEDLPEDVQNKFFNMKPNTSSLKLKYKIKNNKLNILK